MKNKLKNIPWIWIMIGLLTLVTCCYFIVWYLHEKNTVPQICTDSTCFTVELARTPAEQQQGLMYRENMSERHGMLFMFPKSDFHNFWMKNTLIPLDMIWIDEKFKIVRILTAQPCIADPCIVYKPETFAKYVLELNAGITAKYGITEGTIFTMKNIQ